MIKIIKNNSKIIIAFIVGLIFSGVAVYATTYAFAGNNVSFDNTTANLTKQNGDPVETIQDALEAIYRKVPPTCSNSPFQVGDYIDMTPTSTSFTPDRTLTGLEDYDTFKGNAAGTTTVAGTLNPSELSVWRVIRINGDCTVEVVSEYASSVYVKFASKVGYQNLVYYLNEIAKQYANTTYTLDPSNANTPDGAFRNVGYDGQTKQITNTTRIDDTTLGASGGAWYQKTTSMNGEESLGGGDQGYITDLKLMEDAGISHVAYKYNTTTPTPYWLASRRFRWNSTSSWYFSGRVASDSGYIDGSNHYSWSSSSFSTYSNNNAVRPIVTLKSNITHSSGSGTEASHYTLSAS